jgi:hypothetical protein
LHSIFLGNIPGLDEKHRTRHLLSPVSATSSTSKNGEVRSSLLERTPTGYERKVLFSNLPRPCHIEVADLNKNGREDLIVSMFGYLTGRLSWYENLGDDELSGTDPVRQGGPPLHDCSRLQ